MTQKGVSVYYVNQHNVCQCGCVKECWREWVLPWPVILNDVMFSYLPFLLWTFQFALLFLCAAPKSDANSVHRCFCLFLTTVSLPVSFDVLSRTAEHSGIPLKSFFDCNYSCWQSFFFLFFRLSVCWISKMDIRSLTMAVDIFFSGRRWVSRFITEPYTMKDRGIKAAAASTQTPAP